MTAVDATPKGKFLKAIGLDPTTFQNIARVYQIPEHLILGIIRQESGGRAKALRFEPKYKYLCNTPVFAKLMSWTPATEESLQKFSWGLMQIMLATARDLGFDKHPTVLLQPDQNVGWSCLYLSRLFAKYKSWSDTISAYNYGHVAKELLTNRYKNQKYVDGVYRFAEEYRDR